MCSLPLGLFTTAIWLTYMVGSVTGTSRPFSTSQSNSSFTDHSIARGIFLQGSTFGWAFSSILRVANSWRVSLTVLLLSPESVENVVLTALILHNYLWSSSSRGVYCPAGTVDPESRDGELFYGLWRQDSAAQSLLPLTVPKTGHNATTEAKLVWETFMEYFCNEGAIAWQWEACLQHSFGF